MDKDRFVAGNDAAQVTNLCFALLPQLAICVTNYSGRDTCNRTMWHHLGLAFSQCNTAFHRHGHSNDVLGRSP